MRVEKILDEIDERHNIIEEDSAQPNIEYYFYKLVYMKARL